MSSEYVKVPFKREADGSKCYVRRHLRIGTPVLSQVFL